MTVLSFVLGDTFPIKKKFISGNRIRSYIDHSIMENSVSMYDFASKKCFYMSSDMLRKQKAVNAQGKNCWRYFLFLEPC